ncbi:uncharacterized protein BDV14DRAFT_176188 [Aspergillus stella-maris]|uniref:uncharacterized protein n=1 Tax=Aspergillus stella-maris TaxID=1810926 RepID=UPI003CCD5EFB
MENPASIKWRSHRVTLSLRFVAFIASLASVIAFGWSQGNHDGNIVETSDLGNHVIAPVTGTIEYTLIWSLIIIPVELSTPVTLHPALSVTFDLLAWAAPLVTVCIYLALHEPYYSGDGYSCGNMAGRECNGKQVANVEHFGTAMLFLAVIIHFTLFVMACRATDNLRKGQRGEKKVVGDAA